MPQHDGTGPYGEGMFTGRGEGYCALRLPDPGSREPAMGYAGIQGTPVALPGDALIGRMGTEGSAASGAPLVPPTRDPSGIACRGRQCRFGRRRHWGF
jgi:hypothetical protein